MRECINEVADLMRAGMRMFWITTYEEDEVVKDMQELIGKEFPFMSIYDWSNAIGLRKLPTVEGENISEPNVRVREPVAIMEYILSAAGLRKTNIAPEKNIFILKDFNDFFATEKVTRYLKDIALNYTIGTNIIIGVSPQVSFPDDIANLFQVIKYELPDKKLIGNLLKGINNKIQEKSKENGAELLKSVSTEDATEIINACVGLTTKEICTAFSKSVIKTNTVSKNFISRYKTEAVRKNGILDYVIPAITLDDIGGNHVVKNWLYETKELLLDSSAIEFGLPTPKGFVAIGIPGTGKTQIAEAFAGTLNVSLLKLNMSKIMSKLVGESEKKIEQALDMAKASAPCVLLIDEVEKVVSGVGSARIDGGVSNRIMASLLKFMDDNSKKVYTIMTSNDVSMLPPEFTRIGRLDAHWYFGLPTKEERIEIICAHMKSCSQPADINVANIIAENTDGYTGAELKAVVSNSIKKAYFKSKKGEKINKLKYEMEDIMESINEIIPLSVSSKEKINALEKWCEGRARRTNNVEHKENNNKTKQIKMEFSNIFSL